ncbi:hypothetical protein GCM10022246_24840 [Pedobacter ginsengiterrae]|uniref:Cthe-2314-like HEPN domain-containing protein n=1 Tax=Pedobacter ginsengiterrae TaxID=871696 RepID=A0ABP7PU72_9SPHI
MEDDPIARKRGKGGHLDVGDGTDGAIKRMLNIGTRTFIIKDRSIYELITADTLDPMRTNINVPNMAHKLVLGSGIESPLVSQIFLTASMFFRKGSFPEAQLEIIWQLIIELAKEAVNLKDNIDAYYQKEHEANARYEADKNGGKAPAIPSIPDLETLLKTIFQKAEHMYQIMIELSSTVLIDLDLNKQAHFDTFSTLINDKFGAEHGFSQFLMENLEFLKIIKEMRNGLDHRLPKVTVKDYKYNTDTSISLPSIALNAKVAKLEETPISQYLTGLETIFSFTEVLICHLANVSVRRMMGGQIREIPEEKRIYKHVRYCFYIPGLDYYEQ